MKKFKRVVPFVFHRDAERIRELMPFDDGGLGVDSLLTDMAPPPDS